MEARIATTVHETPAVRVTVTGRSSAGTPLGGWALFPDGFACRWSHSVEANGNRNTALFNAAGRRFRNPDRSGAIRRALTA